MDLRNTYIKIPSSSSEFISLQKELFKHGVRWRDTGDETNTDTIKGYITISTELKMVYNGDFSRSKEIQNDFYKFKLYELWI